MSTSRCHSPELEAPFPGSDAEGATCRPQSEYSRLEGDMHDCGGFGSFPLSGALAAGATHIPNPNGFDRLVWAPV